MTTNLNSTFSCRFLNSVVEETNFEDEVFELYFGFNNQDDIFEFPLYTPCTAVVCKFQYSSSENAIATFLMWDTSYDIAFMNYHI